jgi:hypothetical protein
VSDDEAAKKLEEELTTKLTELKDSGKEAVISDLDLSQNHCPADFFETIFSTLSSQNTPVQRLRLFGIPTMTDEAIVPLAEYLKSVPPEAAPFELHLSDCALTTVGFATLMEAIEENSAFPCVNPITKKTAPLYLRLENNYIEPSAMQEKVDANVIKIFLKDRAVGKLAGEEKVYLVKKQNQVGFQQKEGVPPAPEEVEPVRTQVYDWKFMENKQRQQASNWTWVPDHLWSPKQPQWQKPQWQTPQWQNPQWNQGKGNEKGKVAAPKPLITPVGIVPKTEMKGSSAGKGGAASCVWCEKGSCWTHGGGKAGKGAAKGATITAAPAVVSPKGGGKNTFGKNAADRSRTPAPRLGGKPAQPMKPPPVLKKGLPHPWQEQYSEEYQIPYFWNPETLESSWEEPTA